MREMTEAVRTQSGRMRHAVMRRHNDGGDLGGWGGGVVVMGLGLRWWSQAEVYMSLEAAMCSFCRLSSRLEHSFIFTLSLFKTAGPDGRM